jgi:hypothetical protein
MNKKIGLASVFLMIGLGLFVSLVLASAGNFKADIKNYGQCTTNATYQKNICNNENNIRYFECFKEANNLAEKNRTLKKQEIKICKEKRKEISENCKNAFKKSKDDCLIFKYFNKTKEKSCKNLKENIEDELKNVQKCNNDTDCAIGLNLPCSISLCPAAYNKNPYLNKILNLSKEYADNCKEICSMMACMINKNSIAVCENHKCRIKEIKENYCKSSDNIDRKSEMCADNYEPACGWYNNSIQCFKYPCAQTFSNSCMACADKKVLFWTEGECPNAIL